MKSEPFHSQSRIIDNIEVETPLIIPSFSSYGFPNVTQIYGDLIDSIHGVCLVSALDLHLGVIPNDVTDNVNLVVVDSGMYEARSRACSHSDGFEDFAKPDWTREQYWDTVRDLDPSANIILVNYDESRRLELQIACAAEDFAISPTAASDFLLKPDSDTPIVNVARLAEQIEPLQKFDIIGITAREAGESLLKRCRTVIMLRELLSSTDTAKPIHVFGAISPLEIVTFFLCGADIFDGLSWLRLSYAQGQSRAIAECAFDNGKVDLFDSEVCFHEWIANISLLYRLQRALHGYITTYDFDELKREFPLAVKASRVAKLAGANIAHVSHGTFL